MKGRVYPEDFRRRVVAEYEAAPGATLESVATEFGVSRRTLSSWLGLYGTGARTHRVYSEGFRRQAVDQYESTPGATVDGIAAELGVDRSALRTWVCSYGSGEKTAPDGRRVFYSLPRDQRRRPPVGSPISRVVNGAAPLANAETENWLQRLEIEQAQLRAEQARLAAEWETLRSVLRLFIDGATP